MHKSHASSPDNLTCTLLLCSSEVEMQPSSRPAVMAAGRRCHGNNKDALASFARKEEGPELGVDAASMRSDRTQHEEGDLENQDDLGPHLGPRHSNTTSASTWSSEQMSLPQEILFVATVCLTQFCNRTSPAGNRPRPLGTTSCLPFWVWLMLCGLPTDSQSGCPGTDAMHRRGFILRHAIPPRHRGRQPTGH